MLFMIWLKLVLISIGVLMYMGYMFGKNGTDPGDMIENYGFNFPAIIWATLPLIVLIGIPVVLGILNFLLFSW